MNSVTIICCQYHGHDGSWPTGMGSGADIVPGGVQRRGKIEYNIEYRIDIDQTWIRWETIVYIQYIQYIQYSIIFKYNHE